MSKFQSKPTTLSFVSGAILASGATPDSPATTTGIREVAGLLTAANGIDIGAAVARSGAGAVPVTNSIVLFTSTATGNALTLADGVDGQLLTILYIAEAAGGDTGVLTPANRGGYATITFNAIGDSATLIFTNTRWYIVGTRGVTVA
jgi:hypothetical protein